MPTKAMVLSDYHSTILIAAVLLPSCSLATQLQRRGGGSSKPGEEAQSSHQAFRAATRRWLVSQKGRLALAGLATSPQSTCQANNSSFAHASTVLRNFEIWQKVYTCSICICFDWRLAAAVRECEERIVHVFRDADSTLSVTFVRQPTGQIRRESTHFNGNATTVYCLGEELSKDRVYGHEIAGVDYVRHSAPTETASKSNDCWVRTNNENMTASQPDEGGNMLAMILRQSQCMRCR